MNTMKRLISLAAAGVLVTASLAQAPGPIVWAKLSWHQAQVSAGPVTDRQQAFLEAQRQLYQQQQTTQMMSNMLRMQHEANMAIINNIGGTGTTTQWTPQYNYYDPQGNYIRPAP